MPRIADEQNMPTGTGLANPEHAAAAALARANPGVWIELDGHYAPALAAYIKRGEHGSYGPGFTATTRKHPEQKYRVRVFIRYVGAEA